MLIESLGEKTGLCRELDLLTKALHGKAAANLQVDMWAEGMARDMCPTRPELVAEVIASYLPVWMIEATLKSRWDYA